MQIRQIKNRKIEINATLEKFKKWMITTLVVFFYIVGQVCDDD